MRAMSIALRTVIFLFALHGTSAVTAQESTLRSYVDVDSIVVGQRFMLVVVAEHDETTVASFSELVPDTSATIRQFGDLLILREVGHGRARRNGGIIHDSTVIEATAFAIDTAAVGPIPVLFVRAGDSTYTYTDPLLIPVTSVLEPDASDIRDLAPIGEFPTPILAWLLFTAALILAMGAFIYWYRRRPAQVFLQREPEATRLEPGEEARIRLDRLSRLNVDSDEAAETFCVELADTVRTYLSRRTSVHALEMTTSEVRVNLERLAEENVVPRETPDDTGRVLEVCDLAKFAEIFPDEDSCVLQLEIAADIVHRLEDHLRPPEVEAVEEAGDERPDVLLT